MTNSGWATGQSKLVYEQLATLQKLKKFGFHSHTTALWSAEQSSVLSAKFDCPVARNLSLLATVHDCKTDLLTFHLNA